MTAVKALKSPQVADASKDSLVWINASQESKATTDGSYSAKRVFFSENSIVGFNHFIVFRLMQ
jgi:hypothetical protein